jgi:hypothetical protein
MILEAILDEVDELHNVNRRLQCSFGVTGTANAMALCSPRPGPTAGVE